MTPVLNWSSIHIAHLLQKADKPKIIDFDPVFVVPKRWNKTTYNTSKYIINKNIKSVENCLMIENKEHCEISKYHYVMYFYCCCWMAKFLCPRLSIRHPCMVFKCIIQPYLFSIHYHIDTSPHLKKRVHLQKINHKHFLFSNIPMFAIIRVHNPI